MKRLDIENTEIKEVVEKKETVWINPRYLPSRMTDTLCQLIVSDADIDDAEKRLQRFAPFIQKCFPETVPTGGLIESPLQEIPEMQKQLENNYSCSIPGRLMIKLDCKP